MDCGSFVGVTLHRPVTAHQVDFMCPSQYQQDVRQIRTQMTNGQLQQGNSNMHRHSTIGLVQDDMALSSNSSQPYQERRHSLSESFTRDNNPCKQGQLLILNDQNNDTKDEINQEQVEEFADEQGNMILAEKNPQPFEFVCYIPYDSKYTGELEECKCKISLRKVPPIFCFICKEIQEDRAGRTPQKLGYIILNLSEFAGSGSEGISESFLLEGYGGSQRLDNSRVHIYIRMQHNSADPLFKVPQSSSLFRYQNGSKADDGRPHEPLGHWLNPADRKAPPPSPAQNTDNSANTLQLTTASTSSVTYSDANSIQIEPLYSASSQATTRTGSLSGSLGSNVPIFSTVPGGLGHNMSIRVQKTRRDPGDVINEVLAENSAAISTVKEHPSLSSSGSDAYESS